VPQVPQWHDATGSRPSMSDDSCMQLMNYVSLTITETCVCGSQPPSPACTHTCVICSQSHSRLSEVSRHQPMYTYIQGCPATESCHLSYRSIAVHVYLPGKRKRFFIGRTSSSPFCLPPSPPLPLSFRFPYFLFSSQSHPVP